MSKRVTDVALTEALKAAKSYIDRETYGKQDKLKKSSDIIPGTDGMLSLTEQAKMALLVERWNLAWGNKGKYDPEGAPDPERPFYGNGLWMSVEEALKVDMYGRRSLSDFVLQGADARTFYPVHHPGTEYGAASKCAFAQSKAEVISFTDGSVQVGDNCFSLCTNLRVIEGTLLLKGNNPFNRSSKIESVNIASLNRSEASLKLCASLSRESVAFMIEKAANTSLITITLHADVYARLTDETDTEWYELLAKAQAKNISFATE